MIKKIYSPSRTVLERQFTIIYYKPSKKTKKENIQLNQLLILQNRVSWMGTFCTCVMIAAGGAGIGTGTFTGTSLVLVMV